MSIEAYCGKACNDLHSFGVGSRPLVSATGVKAEPGKSVVLSAAPAARQYNREVIVVSRVVIFAILGAWLIGSVAAAFGVVRTFRDKYRQRVRRSTRWEKAAFFAPAAIFVTSAGFTFLMGVAVAYLFIFEPGALMPHP